MPWRLAWWGRGVLLQANKQLRYKQNRVVYTLLIKLCHLDRQNMEITTLLVEAWCWGFSACSPTMYPWTGDDVRQSMSWYPAMQQCHAAQGRGGFCHGNSLWPTGVMVDDCENVGKTIQVVQWPDYVDMNVLKPLAGHGDVLSCWDRVSGPVMDLFWHVWPEVATSYQLGGSFHTGVGQGVLFLENILSEAGWHSWSWLIVQ